MYALNTKKVCVILGTLCIKRDCIGKGLTAVEHLKEDNIIN